MASSGGDNAEDKLAGGAAPIASDEGESHHSRDKHSQGDHSRDDLVEYLGTIKKGIRRLLPYLPDLTLLRFLGGRIQPPFLGSRLGSSNSSSRSSSSSKSWSDPGLPPELKSNGIAFFLS